MFKYILPFLLFCNLNANSQIIKHGELQSYSFKQGYLSVTISSNETILFDSVKLEIILGNSGFDTMLVFDSEELYSGLNRGINNYRIALGTSASGMETTYKMHKIYPQARKKYFVIIRKDTELTGVPQESIFTYFEMVYIPKLKKVREYIVKEKINEVEISSLSLAFNSFFISIGGLVFDIY